MAEKSKEAPNTQLTRADGSGAMFDNLAKRYDLLNRLMSFGVDKRWRRRTVKALNLSPGNRVLDLATGTADLAIDIVKRSKGVEVVGVDPSVGMLEVGREKISKKGLSERIKLQEGIGEDLQFEDDYFNGATIAFGIRNCTDRPKALREMARVCKPGSRVCVLELNEPEKGIVAPMARFHIHKIVPMMGAWLSGAKEYRYLQTSIAAFPPAEEFAAIMEENGLKMVELVPFSFGACHLYVSEVVKGATVEGATVGETQTSDNQSAN